MYNGPVSYNESVTPTQVTGTGAALGFGIFTSKLVVDGVKSLVSNACQTTPVVIEQSVVDQVVETCSKAVPVMTVAVATVTLTGAAGKAVKAGWQCAKSAGIWACDLATGCFKKATSWFTKKPSSASASASASNQTTAQTTAPAASAPAASAPAASAPAASAPAAQTATAPAASAPAASTPAPASVQKN